MFRFERERERERVTRTLTFFTFNCFQPLQKLHSYFYLKQITKLIKLLLHPFLKKSTQNLIVGK
jgi:hypothetical protein